jgi:hypothetical protein
VRRRFLFLSIANWIIAIVVWSISAYLGVAAPTSIFVYTILFVIGLFAVVVAIASFLLWRHGEEPGTDAGAAGASADAGDPADAGDEPPAARPGIPPAREAPAPGDGQVAAPPS